MHVADTPSVASRIELAFQSASNSTGTSFDYLVKTAARESSFNPSAKAKTSSATGLFQFIESTWLETMKEAGPRHGLEKYSDLSKPIRFTLDPGGGPAIESEAYVLSDGGSIDADWALLKLHDPVSAERVAALIVAIDDIDAGRDLVMAGYSRDKGLGAGGDRLTYDPACQVTDSDKVSTTTNCIAHKGASGGPVIQHDSAGRPAVYGVISEGNGAGVSIFIPTRAFRQAVRTYL